MRSTLLFQQVKNCTGANQLRTAVLFWSWFWLENFVLNNFEHCIWSLYIYVYIHEITCLPKSIQYDLWYIKLSAHIWFFISGTHPVGVNPRSVVSMAEVSLHLFFSPFFVHKKGCLCPGGGGHLNPHLRLNQWLPGGRCLPSLDFDLIPNLQFWLQSKPPILTSIQTSNFYPNPNLQDPPDVVITVCNRASETCPRFPVKTQVSEILREKTCS